MPERVMTDAFVLINSVDLSAQVLSVTVSHEKELVPATAAGDTTRKVAPGLNNWEIAVTFKAEFSDDGLDEQLWDLQANATPFPVEVRPTSAARSVSNAAYVGNAYVGGQLTPIAGRPGELMETTVTFRPGGDSNDLQRLTA